MSAPSAPSPDTLDGPCGPVSAAALAHATEQVLGAGAQLGEGQRDAVSGVIAAESGAALAVLPPA